MICFKCDSDEYHSYAASGAKYFNCDAGFTVRKYMAGVVISELKGQTILDLGRSFHACSIECANKITKKLLLECPAEEQSAGDTPLAGPDDLK
ncbi:MAG: hypothetical protein ACRD22_06910 [Terriglobia bacterium]